MSGSLHTPSHSRRSSLPMESGGHAAGCFLASIPLRFEPICLKPERAHAYLCPIPRFLQTGLGFAEYRTPFSLTFRDLHEILTQHNRNRGLDPHNCQFGTIKETFTSENIDNYPCQQSRKDD